MPDSSSPRAGWYADPENPTRERWWNGSAWSDTHRDPVTTPAPPSAPAGFTFGTQPGAPGADPYAPAPYAPAQYAPAPYVASPYVASSPLAPYGSSVPGSGPNGLAIAGLIVSAAGWLLLGALAGIAGIVLSAFGLARAKRAEAAGNPRSGRGLAVAGLVIGIVVTAVGALVVTAYVVFLFGMGNAF